MDTLLVDIRFGVRQLFRQRGSSIVAIVTLALGMGASTAIFSVIDATMLRPLPYPDPEQLVAIEVEVDDRGDRHRPTPSMADMRAWQAADDIFSAVAASGGAFRGRITDGAAPERIRVDHFTEDYLPMHGVTPILGRGFTRDDTDPGSPLVALLGYGYWQSRYSGRDDVVGESIRLDDENATIIGVLPAWFNATTPLTTPLRVPARLFYARGTGAVRVDARLRPGLTIEQALQRLQAQMSNAPKPPRDRRDARPLIRSRLESSTLPYRASVVVFAGAVGLILLIAAVNVAGLQLARGSARASEFAVRASLGAGRGRLIRQLLTEGLALAIPATALGLLLAWLSLGIIEANLPFTLPQNSPIAINRTVLLMTVALLVPTTLLFSVVPAFRLTHFQIDAVLARASRQLGSSFSRRGGQLLIAAEIAVALVLVTGAGLMIRSFIRMSSIELGFTTDRLITMEVLPLERTAAAHTLYYDQLLQRLRTTPSIASAGLVDHFVLTGGYAMTGVTVDGKDVDITIFEASPGYLDTIGAHVTEGRLNAADAAAASRSVVINESAARTLFPPRGAIGREVVRPSGSFTISAVIGDLRHGGPLDQRGIGQLQMFFPLEPSDDDLNAPVMVAVRPAGRSASMATELRSIAQSIGPRVLVERVRLADEYFGDRVVTPRRRMVLLGLLAGLGLALALVGVFGMTAYAVTRRTAEIGVRMACGASPARVIRTMLKDAAVPIAIGTVLGIGGAVASARVIRSFLFETDPTDAFTLASVALVLVITGCLAALLPAMRAAKVDPASSLRTE